MKKGIVRTFLTIMLALPAALAIGACSDGDGNTSSSTSGTGPTTPPPAHVHTFDEHGFCLADGYYGGTTLESDTQTWTITNTEVNKAYYGRIKLQNGKNYMLNATPMDPKIDSTKTKVWWKTSTGWADVDLNYGLTLSGESSDQYAYFHLEFSQGLPSVALGLAELHVHSYDAMGLCENCPYGEGIGYRGTPLNNLPLSDEVTPNTGENYYEARFMYVPSQVYFFDSQVTKSGENVALKIGYLKTVAGQKQWEYIYNQHTANTSMIIANLADIASSYIYVKWSWNTDDVFTNNSFSVSILNASHYFDTAGEYRGQLITDEGVGYEEQVLGNYVVPMGNIKMIYFGWDIVSAGQRYRVSLVGFPANSTVAAYQAHPDTHQPVALQRIDGDFFEAKYNGAIGFELYYTGTDDIVGTDSYKVGVEQLAGLHTADSIGFCKIHESTYLGNPTAWTDESGISGDNFVAGKKYFYKIGLLKGQFFRFEKTVINWDEIYVYYRTGAGDRNNNYREIPQDSFKNGGTVHFESDFDNTAYVVIEVAANRNDVSITPHFESFGYTFSAGYAPNYNEITISADNEYHNVTFTQNEWVYVRFAADPNMNYCEVFYDYGFPMDTYLWGYNADDNQVVEQNESIQQEYDLEPTDKFSSSDDVAYYVFAIRNTGTTRTVGMKIRLSNA